MAIKIRYENKITTVEIPEEDFTIMIQRDYEDRLARAEDPASVFPRTPQEIMDERFNRPDYNNWHRHNRHWDTGATPPSVYGGTRHLSDNFGDEEEPHHFTMDEFPDMAAIKKQEEEENDQELRAWIRKKMKPDYAEMLIAIHMDGMTVTDYAKQIGEKRITVSHRLQRAEKKLKEIFPKRPV